MQPVQPDGVFAGWTWLQPAIVFVSPFVGWFLSKISGWLWYPGIPVSFWVGTVVDASARPAEEPILGWFVVPAYVVGTLVVGFIVDPFILDPIKESRLERDREEWRREYIEKHGTDPYEKDEVWEGGEVGE
jgi:hypothetical protein